MTAVAAQCRLLFHQRNGIPFAGKCQGAFKPRNATAHHQSTLGDRHFLQCRCGEKTGACDTHANPVLKLGGRGVFIHVSQIYHFVEIGVQPRQFQGLLKQIFVNDRRAGGEDQPVGAGLLDFSAEGHPYIAVHAECGCDPGCFGCIAVYLFTNPRCHIRAQLIGKQNGGRLSVIGHGFRIFFR